MDHKDTFLKSISYASSIIAQVKPTDYELPTPDTEWSVRDLLDHIIYELAWSADIVTGKTIDQVGSVYDGDLIGNDLQTSWGAYVESAQQAIMKADSDATVHLSYGPVPLKQYLDQAAADQLIHAWDLGTAIGITVAFPDDLAERIYNYSWPRADDMRRSGLFADPIEVPPGASLQTKLLALYGRAA